MASNPLRRLLCFFGIHKRSRGGVRETGDTVLSNCKHCRVPMYKLDGKWLVRR